MKWKPLWKVFIAVLVSVCLGLLEAAWTSPTAPGANRPMLGCFGIGVILAVVCWPRLWWVPGLGMLEEIVQVYFGMLPGSRTPIHSELFHHWSAAFTWINLYPYISFPLIGVLAEAAYQYRHRIGGKNDR